MRILVALVVVVVSCAYNASEINRKENTRLKRIKVYTAHPHIVNAKKTSGKSKFINNKNKNNILIIIKLKMIIVKEMVIIRIERNKSRKKTYTNKPNTTRA